MGQAGGSFASGFAQTLMQGLQLQEQIAARQEELKIKRDLADANLKQHAAQTAAIEAKVRAGAKLAAKLMPQQIGGGMEGPQATVPGQLTPQDLASYAAESGDVDALIRSQQPHYFNPQQGLSSVIPGSTQASQIAAPQPPAVSPLAQRFLDAAGFGTPGQPQGEAAAPSMGGGAPTQPASIQPQQEGGVRYEPPKITLDEKGGLTFTSGPVKASVHIENIVDPKTGQAQKVAVAIDPTNPNNRQVIPLGKPIPSEQLQRFDAIANSWGIPPGPLREWAVGAIADVTTTYTGPAQAIAMEDLKQKMLGLVPGGGAGGGKSPAAGGKVSGVPSALQKQKQLEVQTAAERTAAEIQAKNENEPPSAQAANKLQMLNSVERQMELVKQNFNEKYVGKGFGAFSDQLKKEYATQEKLAEKGKYAGAFAGNVRAFFGNISPEEVTFRNSLLDAADLLLRARSGAQINEQEYNRLKSVLPQLTDEPNVFLPALKRFSDEVRAQGLDTLKLGSTSSKELLKQREGTGTKPPPGFRRE